MFERCGWWKASYRQVRKCLPQLVGRQAFNLATETPRLPLSAVSWRPSSLTLSCLALRYVVHRQRGPQDEHLLHPGELSAQRSCSSRVPPNTRTFVSLKRQIGASLFAANWATFSAATGCVWQPRWPSCFLALRACVRVRVRDAVFLLCVSVSSPRLLIVCYSWCVIDRITLCTTNKQVGWTRAVCAQSHIYSVIST